MHSLHRRWVFLLIAVAIIFVPTPKVWGAGQAAAALQIAALASPTTVYAGRTVEYTLAISNSAQEVAGSASIASVLPAGFGYVAGSTQVRRNGVLVSTQDPSINGATLTWGGLDVPGARTAAHYGMHTFLQDKCEGPYIRSQLDRVRELMGPGAFVKQLLYHITEETAGPQGCWVDFVNAAYDRDLVPVVRLQGNYGGPNWIKPAASSPGDYTAIAGAYARVVSGLPRRDGKRLYVEVWNEPNLNIEWGGQANPVEYAHFLVDVAAALRALRDARIVILNGALSPGGDYNNLNFINAMATVPGAMQAFDVWAAHPYPGNHPPEYNIHDGTAPIFPELTIDSYLLELERLAKNGRKNVSVLLTETGYALGQNNFNFQGYPTIDEQNRADYIARALRDFWSRWPEVIGVCPYELVDPHGSWAVWDWMYPDGRHHQQFDAVLALSKSPQAASGTLVVRFRARASDAPGSYAMQVSATSSNLGTASLSNAAPVQVNPPPPSPTPTNTPTPTRTLTPTPVPVCYPVLKNGGFEADDAWEIPHTAYWAAYSNTQAHSGQRSMRIGIVDDQPVESYSSARQSFSMPPSAQSVRISFWYYPISQDVRHGRQYVLLLDGEKQYVETILWIASNAAQWKYYEATITGYAGQTLWLQFGASNDGQGGATAMYVDDARVEVCGPEGFVTPTPGGPTIAPSPTLTPSPTATTAPSLAPTATALPLPSATPVPSATLLPGCREVMVNGDFETREGWSIPDTAYPARYCDTSPYSGNWAACLGIENPKDNWLSYSSIEQKLTIPDMPYVSLSFRYYPISGDAQGDRQYLLLLDEQGNYHTLMWIISDAQSWLTKSVDLTAYRGQVVTLRFSVYNDGEDGITAMRLDAVSLLACASGPQPTWTPTAMSTPTPTPLPVAPTPTPRITPEAPAFVLATVPVGRAPHGVAVDARDGRVYVANYLGGDLSLLDPDAVQVTGAISLLNAAGCNGVAVDAGRSRAYVANGLSHNLAVVDLTGGNYLASVPLHQEPLGVQVDSQSGTVYVSNYGAGSISVVDGTALTETATLSVGTEPAGLAFDPLRERLIVANHHYLLNSLSVFPLLGGSTTTIPVGGGPYGVALDPGTGRVFTANTAGNSVSAVEVDGQVCEVPLPDAVYLVAFNPRSGHLFAVCPDSQTVYVLDGARLNILATLPVGREARYGIAVDENRQRVYIANAEDDTVTVIQDVAPQQKVALPLLWKMGGQTQATAPLAEMGAMSVTAAPLIAADRSLPQRPLGMRALPLAEYAAPQARPLAVDSMRRRLWLAVDDRVLAVDAPTGRPLVSVRLSGQAGAATVEADSGRLFVAVPERGEIQVLDRRGIVLQTLDGLGRPMNLIEGNGKVYVADSLGQRLVVLDGQTCAIIAALKLPAPPFGLALDAPARRLYVGQMGSGQVLALDADTLDLAGEATCSGLGFPLDLALDGSAHRLYVAHAVSPKYGALTVIDTTDMSLIATLSGNQQQPLYGVDSVRVDSERGEVFLGQYAGVIVLDARGLAIREQVGAEAPKGPGGLVFDSLEGTLYLGDNQGRLWSWQGTIEREGN